MSSDLVFFWGGVAVAYTCNLVTLWTTAEIHKVKYLPPRRIS